MPQRWLKGAYNMKFGIPKQPKIPTPQEAYNSLIGAVDDEKIIKLDISLLDEVEQPFSVNDEKVQDIAKSITKIGLADPIIVRKNEKDRYDILAGRHRVRACKLLGFDKINSVIKDVDDNTARAILLVTNTDRNNEYKPSELAKAYAEYEELIKQLDNKTAVSAQLAERFKTDRKQIYRYKRLNFLIPDLLNMVDDKKLPFLAGVSLSHIDVASQKRLATYLKRNNCSVTTKEAEMLRSFDSSHFYFEALDEFFNPKPAETIIPQSINNTDTLESNDNSSNKSEKSDNESNTNPSFDASNKPHQKTKADKKPNKKLRNLLQEEKLKTIDDCATEICKLLRNRTEQELFELRIGEKSEDYQTGYKQGYFDLIENVCNLIECNYLEEALIQNEE